ncbi:MAG TPA: DEAD/DEAH box helicase [Streptosporangiaceae bacterium]|nr:DEAD/DEAH box helicase [Streptosporangiaceae bacterium]
MLAIHGVWAQGVLALWAEDSELPSAVPARSARPSRVPRSHPFCASPDVVADALAEFGETVGDLVRKAADDELTLWLPGSAASPAPSPDLIRDDIVPRRPAGSGAGAQPLNAWRVLTLTFDPAPALALLALIGQPPTGQPVAGQLELDGFAAADQATGPHGARSGRAVMSGSVHYLAATGALAADLAARGRVLPGLDKVDDGNYMAIWRPVLAGPDALRARELTAALPPLCRATSETGEPQEAMFGQALERLTDAAVRRRLEREPGFSLLPQTRATAAQPLTERWLAALTGDSGEVAVGPRDGVAAAQLAFALWSWQDAAQLPPGPVRTCFKLVEPPPDDQPDEQDEDAPARDHAAGAGQARWRVEFALQSTDDPSLLLPAAEIWSGDTADGWAAVGIPYPEEDLLAGLGRASRLFPSLDAELQAAAPEAAELDNAGALRFLKETGPMLAGAGFGVLLPDWVRKSRLGLRLNLRSRTAASAASAPAAGKFGLNDLVDFSYELAVGGQTLTEAELAELARLKVPLVRVRGQWVELDERHLQAALKFLERRGSGVMTSGEALAAGLSETADLPTVEVSADGWLGDLLSGEAEQRLAPMVTPASFHGQLRPYQERGLSWLTFLGGAGLGAILADDMGLGKTAASLALLAHEQDDGTRRGPSLLVCPMSLVGNWQREAARFTPGLAVHVHHGGDRLTGADLTAALTAADLVVTSYGVATRDREALSRVHWARVICDEAQNIKNSGTRQAQAVRAIPARSRIALTGTPVENRLSDLWSLMEFTSPGLLGPAEKFRQRFAIPIERAGDEEAAARLRRITGPFILRRLKTDKTIIADLPDKLEMKVWCNLTPEQASLYQATVDDMMERIEAAEPGIERRGLVLATMARLKQVCNHPAHLLADGSRLDGRSGKLARLEEIAEEIVTGGDKALCFTQYAEFGHMLQPYLAARLGCEVLYLHGGTPKKKRDEMVTEFQEGTGPSLFLLSLKAGGTGLNLTAASHVIHVDRWWNPAVEDQATDRAFRIGQRRDVQVRKFVCVGTVEERIDAMIEEKKALADKIVGTGESWLTELSVADLRDVISLSPEAVSQ